LAAPCAGTVAYDVWYKFTAVTNNTATITLSSLGANFTSSGLQIFSGSCGSLTSIACSNSTSVTTPALTTGNVYYIRVFSTAAGAAPNGNARFNICATTTNAPVRSGNSYVNISRKTTGGVVQPGDTLEIRFTVNHTSGTMTALRFVDNVPAKTSMLTTSNDSIRIITNEGLTYKRYTVASGDDAASYKASPSAGEYNIRMNLGFSSGAAPNVPTVMTNAATSANGQMSSSDKPVGGGGLLFAISYRVVVTGVVGDTITLFPGQFIYNNGITDVTLTATPFNILITNPLNLCVNSIGLNNAVENGGTFGSGTTLNRSTDLTTPIAGYTFIPDVSAFTAVNDGRYAIVKNMSPRSSPVSNARRQPNCNVAPAVGPNDPLSCNNRMFGGYWYIDGDHSGTNNSIGNAPPDATTNSGYMLEVNADYVASEVYRQTITNLCPNTYYEFSAWVRNICPNCGIDSTGAQFAGTSTAPANGYPGVKPNLTFTLDSLDYYNTGEIDTVGWLKKGFVFKTTPSQTTASFSIRNNAQGGGGNDWTLDDIAIATCLPSMQYSPSINPMVCQLNPLNIFDTVRSYFNNYTDFKWERSTDLGNTWSDISAAVDTTVTLIGSTYQFITKYTIPATQTTLANSNDLYRVVVATSNSNLVNSACLYTDASTIITLNVLDCGPVLSVDLLSFNGKNNNGIADLLWVASKETEPVSYNVEKSMDGTIFNSIATVKGHGNANENNYYELTDPAVITGKVWYRIAVVNKDGKKKYSRVILLNDKSIDFGFSNVINPFSNEIDFEISVPENSRIDAILLNSSGKPVRKESFSAYEGVNSLSIPGTESLPAGMYILRAIYNDKVITKKMIKK
ncbi:MAG: T9SS type A sorting domain-containing protein, partial [Chitinophagales bacterium]